MWKKNIPKGKGKTKTKSTVALVNKVVNRKLNQFVETKSAINGSGQFQYQDDVRVTNLEYFMTQGDALAQYTGRVMNLKNIHIKGRLYLENPGSQPNGICARLMVVKSKTPLTNTSTVTTFSNIFRAGGQPYYASTGHVDLGKVSLLYDKTFTIQPFNSAVGSGAANRYVAYDIKIPFKGKKVYWDDNNSGYLKDGNHYLVCTVDSINATTAIDRVALNNFTWTVNFQDA